MRYIVGMIDATRRYYFRFYAYPKPMAGAGKRLV